MKILFSVTAVIAALVAPAAQAASLRIAAVTGVNQSCRVLAADAPPGQRAYFRHLASRLDREILTCPVIDRAAAAQALAAGRVDVAVLDAAAYAPVRSTTRSILTVRAAGQLNRIPIVVAVMARSRFTGLSTLRGRSAVFGGTGLASLAEPSRVLAENGVDSGFFSRRDVAASADAAAVRLRSGTADALVLNAAAWQRLCRGERPQDRQCADLKVIWQGRRRAPMAMVVRRDMPDPLRFQLMGIEIALHLEARDAFAWAASWTPNGVEFEPTEADALAPSAN